MTWRCVMTLTLAMAMSLFEKCFFHVWVVSCFVSIEWLEGKMWFKACLGENKLLDLIPVRWKWPTPRYFIFFSFFFYITWKEIELWKPNIKLLGWGHIKSIVRSHPCLLRWKWPAPMYFIFFFKNVWKEIELWIPKIK